MNNKLHTLQTMHLPFGFPSYSSAQTIFLHAKETAYPIIGPVATMVVLQPECFMQVMSHTAINGDQMHALLTPQLSV